MSDAAGWLLFLVWSVGWVLSLLFFPSWINPSRLRHFCAIIWPIASPVVGLVTFLNWLFEE